MDDWRKSSHSTFNSNCVEAAGNWVKASLSFSNGNCAEVAACGCRDGVLVRDSKLAAASPVLAFSAGAWRQFTAALKAA